MIKTSGKYLIIGVFLAALAVQGYYRLFIGFTRYDDEGYILFSILEYLKGGVLFDRIFTWYGPAFYLINEAAFSLMRLPATHDTIRLLSLFFWIAGCGAVSLAAFRMTGNLLSAVLTAAGVFTITSFMTSEPGHPQWILFFLTGSCFLLLTCRINLATLILLGFIAGTALCIKINSGLFLTGAIISFYVSVSGINTKMPRMFILYGILLVLFPFVLMRQRITDPVVLMYAFTVFFTLGTMALFQYRMTSGAGYTSRYLRLFFVLSGIFALLFIAAALYKGTSPYGLYHGLIVNPASIPKFYFVNPQMPSFGVYIILLLLAVPGVIFFSSGRTFFHISFPAKIIFSGLVFFDAFRSASLNLFYYPLFAWLILLPQGRNSGHEQQNISRTGLFALLSFSLLTAYPVCGTHKSMATFLLIPAAAVLAADMLEYFKRPMKWIFSSLLIGSIAIFIHDQTVFLRTYYNHHPAPVDLKGLSRLHWSEKRLAVYEGLTQNIRENAGYLFMIPGVYSLNIWSGVPSPVDKNVNNWPVTLDEKILDGFIKQISGKKGVVLVRDYREWKVLLKYRDLYSLPLMQYLDREFTLVANIENYDILVRKNEKDSFRLTGAMTVKDGFLIRPPKMNAGLCNLEIYNTRERKTLLKKEWLSGEAAGEVFLPFMHDASGRIENICVVRGTDPAGRLLFRLPFIRADH